MTFTVHHLSSQHGPSPESGTASVLRVPPPAPGRIAPETTTLWLVGELDLATTPDVADLIGTSLADRPTGPVLVDLSRVTFMDAAGLRALLALRSALQPAGRDLVLRAPSPPVELVLRATGTLDDFSVVGRSASWHEADDRDDDQAGTVVALYPRR